VWIEIELDVRDDGLPGSEGLNVDKYEVLDNGVLKVEYDKRVKQYSPGYWRTVEEDTLSREERQKFNEEAQAKFGAEMSNLAGVGKKDPYRAE
jgi:hypothetical protein